MSGSNGSSPPLPEITLAELERLIRLLGMLGSEHDGESLNAGRLAAKWVRDMGTDWRTLLTPPEELLPVTGVGPPVDVDALAQAAEVERVQAFQNGYAAGVTAATAAIKAGMAQQPPQQTVHPAAQPAAGLGGFNPSRHAWVGMGINGLGGGLGAQQAQPAPTTGPAHQGPQAASGGSRRGNWAQGTWQWVCQELLDRQGQGIPGVFRGPKEEAFVRDVLKRGFPSLTPAQDTWLRDIAGRNGLSW